MPLGLAEALLPFEHLARPPPRDVLAQSSRIIAGRHLVYNHSNREPAAKRTRRMVPE